MEIAIFVSHPEQYRGCDLSDYSFTYGDAQNNGVYHAYETVQKLLMKYDKTKFDQLYFGSEFCENLIPTIEELKFFLNKCKADGLGPVFVTPVVTDRGIAKLKVCFDFLDAQGVMYSTVVNDVGVLQMLSECAKTKSVIIGRLFDKTSHDSRISQKDIPSYYGAAGIRYAGEPGILSDHSRRILKSFGVQRFEFDLPKVGIYPDRREDYGFSLYWPFHYLTTGRVCLFRAADREGKDKFLVGGKPCRGICKKKELELRKPVNGFSPEQGVKKNDLYLFQKGNTIFYLYDHNDLEALISRFDRVIIQVL